MSATDGGFDPATKQAIDTYLADWLAEGEAPGVSYAVFDADGVLAAEGLGTRSRRPNQPATPDTRYYVGSITKVATAVAVLQQVERGAVALDDAVADHVDLLPDAPGAPITVRELLTHTSGLPTDHVPATDHIADGRDLALYVNGGIDARLDDDRFRYFNSGFKVLGELVAALDGRPYATYVAEEVLEPLGMDRSTFDQSVMTEGEEVAPPHESDDDELVPAELPLDFEVQPADGGLISTVHDLSRLLRCVLGDGALDGTRLLEPETVERMRARQVETDPIIDGPVRGYGFGLEVDDLLDDTLIGHRGSVVTSQASVSYLADRGLGAAVAVNAGAGYAVPRAVLAIAAGADPERAVPHLGLEAKAEAVAGTYESYGSGPAATVEPDGAQLTVTIDAYDETIQAFPETTAPDDYRYYTVHRAGRRTPLEFRELDDGLALLWSRGRFDRTPSGG